MPEVLKFEDSPGVFLEFHIEPFQEEYIPGSIILSTEGDKDNQVYFQIPTPIAQKLNKVELEKVKRQVHEWWLNKKA